MAMDWRQARKAVTPSLREAETRRCR